jgi:hypothetical protein
MGIVMSKYVSTVPSLKVCTLAGEVEWLKCEPDNVVSVAGNRFRFTTAKKLDASTYWLEGCTLLTDLRFHPDVCRLYTNYRAKTYCGLLKAGTPMLAMEIQSRSDGIGSVHLVSCFDEDKHAIAILSSTAQLQYAEQAHAFAGQLSDRPGIDPYTLL